MGILMTAASSLVIAYLVGTIFLYQKRLQDMTASVETLADGGHQVTLASVNENDEIGRLAQAITRLANTVSE